MERVTRAAALSTLLAVGTEVNSEPTQAGDSAIIQALRRGAGTITQSNGPAIGPAQSQHPADVDDPSGISGEGDRQPRSGA